VAPPRRILPDGCADVIVAVGRSATEALVVGPMSAAILVAPRAALFVGVRFRPGCARPFLGVPLAELADRRVDLGELWGDAGELLARAHRARGAGAIVALLAASLAGRSRDAARSPLVSAAVERLADDAAAGARVEELAAALGVTRQHLARRFRDEVGQSPKRLHRVLRMRRSLDGLRAAAAGGKRADLARLALEGGYADQSHMNADFRELAGASPLALLAGDEVPFFRDSGDPGGENGRTAGAPPVARRNHAAAGPQAHAGAGRRERRGVPPVLV
jgi:AraC-like DNA-binding protein